MHARFCLSHRLTERDNDNFVKMTAITPTRNCECPGLVMSDSVGTTLARFCLSHETTTILWRRRPGTANAQVCLCQIGQSHSITDSTQVGGFGGEGPRYNFQLQRKYAISQSLSQTGPPRIHECYVHCLDYPFYFLEVSCLLYLALTLGRGLGTELQLPVPEKVRHIPSFWKNTNTYLALHIQPLSQTGHPRCTNTTSVPCKWSSQTSSQFNCIFIPSKNWI